MKIFFLPRLTPMSLQRTSAVLHLSLSLSPRVNSQTLFSSRAFSIYPQTFNGHDEPTAINRSCFFLLLLFFHSLSPSVSILFAIPDDGNTNVCAPRENSLFCALKNQTFLLVSAERERDLSVNYTCPWSSLTELE